MSTTLPSPGQPNSAHSGAGKWPIRGWVNEPQSESALLAAARQLSEEAASRPRLAGLTGVRRRDAALRSRRAAGHTSVLPVV